jgi:hypothetical protein
MFTLSADADFSTAASQQDSVQSQMRCVQSQRIAGMKTNADLELERIIYERDIQRTHWLIKAYHRTRIQKLEKNAQYYLHHMEYTRRLSSAELDYVKNYFVSIGRYAPAFYYKV